MVKLLLGDLLVKLKELDDNSIDSVVTDPPYHLTSIVKRFSKTNIDNDGVCEKNAKNRSDSYARLSRGFMGQTWDGGDIAFRPETWIEILRVLKPGGHLLAFSGTRTYHKMVCGIEVAGFEIRDMISWNYGSGFPKSLNISKAIDKMEGKKFRSEPASELAQKYNGYGTALKPANEPIVVARKPLAENNVAKNVIKYGTGGLNIDDCRIHTEGSDSKSYTLKRLNPGATVNTTNKYRSDDNIEYNGETKAGRWPANFIHDGSDVITNALDEADKFFYCAKPSQKERDDGLDDFDSRSGPTMGSGIGGQPDQNNEKYKNFHPTVKPIKLMRYLCRLVTPKNGIVLDPFMGSGTTGKAAILEGFDFVGIELSDEYYKIASARINNTTKESNITNFME